MALRARRLDIPVRDWATGQSITMSADMDSLSAPDPICQALYNTCFPKEGIIQKRQPYTVATRGYQTHCLFEDANNNVISISRPAANPGTGAVVPGYAVSVTTTGAYQFANREPTTQPTSKLPEYLTEIINSEGSLGRRITDYDCCVLEDYLHVIWVEKYIDDVATYSVWDRPFNQGRSGRLFYKKVHIPTRTTVYQTSATSLVGPTVPDGGMQDHLRITPDGYGTQCMITMRGINETLSPTPSNMCYWIIDNDTTDFEFISGETVIDLKVNNSYRDYYGATYDVCPGPSDAGGWYMIYIDDTDDLQLGYIDTAGTPAGWEDIASLSASDNIYNLGINYHNNTVWVSFWSDDDDTFSQTGDVYRCYDRTCTTPLCSWQNINNDGLEGSGRCQQNIIIPFSDTGAYILTAYPSYKSYNSYPDGYWFHTEFAGSNNESIDYYTNQPGTVSWTCYSDGSQESGSYRQYFPRMTPITRGFVSTSGWDTEYTPCIWMADVLSETAYLLQIENKEDAKDIVKVCTTAKYGTTYGAQCNMARTVSASDDSDGYWSVLPHYLSARRPGKYTDGVTLTDDGTSTDMVDITVGFSLARAYQPSIYQTASVSGRTYIAGGILTYWDGEQLVESSYVQQPWLTIERIAEADAPYLPNSTTVKPNIYSGSGTDLYSYILIYEIYHKGAKIRSIASNPKQVTINNEANGYIRISMSPNNLTLTGSYKTVLSLYRTKSNGANYYRMCAWEEVNGLWEYQDGLHQSQIGHLVPASTPGSGLINEVNGVFFGTFYSVFDDVSDEYLDASELLYSQSLMPNDPPWGGVSYITSARGRLWMASAEEPTKLMYTTETEGSQTPVSYSLGYELYTDYPITGVQAFGSDVYVFTARKIYVVEGDGPDNTGNPASGSFSLTPLRGDFGCAQPYSMSQTQYGIYFLHNHNIHFIDSSRNVNKITNNLDEFYNNETISCCWNNPIRQEVYWLFEKTSSTTGDMLVLDYSPLPSEAPRYMIWTLRTRVASYSRAHIGLADSQGRNWVDDGQSILYQLPTGSVDTGDEESTADTYNDYTMSIQFNNIDMGYFSLIKRIWRMIVLLKEPGYGLLVSITTDDGAGGEGRTYTVSELLSLYTYSSLPVVYDFTNQTNRSVKISLSDVPSDTGQTILAKISGISIEYGVQPPLVQAFK